MRFITITLSSNKIVLFLTQSKNKWTVSMINLKSSHQKVQFSKKMYNKKIVLCKTKAQLKKN